jgi:tRNA(Ile)-lysidine synthase
MIKRFTGFIEEKQLFKPADRILLAVSGGIDSMVLLHLFQNSGFNFGVVHCNFQLRGEDSDRDEELVRQHVLINGIPSFFKKFNTRETARINGISIEMAARQLRYDYFETVREENGFDYVATAHHLDDQIETFFLNLSRKTGIRGLSGIKEKSGKIIRPLIFAGRDEIENYARKYSIEFREDYTNSDTEFRRNFIRHRIITLFKELNPVFKANMAGTIENLREVEEVYFYSINKAAKKVITKNDTGIIINISFLLQSPFPKSLLFETLTEFNFNPAVIKQIAERVKSISGKQYYSKTHRLVKDRDNLFVVPLPEEDERIYYIEEDDMELFSPFDMVIEKIDSANFRIIKNSNIATIDFEKLQFPLLIRKWKQGDFFKPLGMTGFKKLSDFFIDEKIPVHEKEKIWLLCSGPEIVWVIGYRIDNRFKITSRTKKIFKIELKN